MKKDEHGNPRHNIAAMGVTIGCMALILIIVFLLEIFTSGTVVISHN